MLARFNRECDLGAPPPLVANTIQQHEPYTDAPKVNLVDLREWAGEPFHSYCSCRHCGKVTANGTRTSEVPGWLGGYLVDRRMVALALQLPRSGQRACQVAHYPKHPEHGDGGPIRIWGRGWWAILMGLRHHHEAKGAPRFDV
jgi:hypothetical protein